tara:strand:- start:104 stop:1645 length:1542 start_codon:yes stop_codon:yes gene_type:complete
MIKTIQIQVDPECAEKKHLLIKKISEDLNIIKNEIKDLIILKKSIDARQKHVKINLKIDVYINEEHLEKVEKTKYKNVSKSKEVIIIGAGPAGLFAALKLIEDGIKPIIIERGKEVRNRRRDLAKITKEHIVNEDSNYCFGEGGAGTFSDGKLYTRSKKRGDVNRILDILVEHGATKQIRIDAHPHIGTNKLPKIIENIRETIINYGGEIHFNSRVSDITIIGNKVSAIVLKDSTIINCKKIILATGHSARDIFYMLNEKGIAIEAKSFALGVRVEHTQNLIDQIQYKCESRGEYLPPAPYSIARQINGRGVYSFCMCPGGIIAPCATSQNEVVTNGWSPSKRDFPTSNSGIVVGLNLEDFKEFKKHGPLAGLEFQKKIENNAWKMGGETQKVPAQRLVDFVNGKISKDVPETSYLPGVQSSNLKELLPDFILKNIQKGFLEFGKHMKGFFTNDAVVHAPESRTSSPVRIPRNPLTLEHINIKGLYPCGEGAGYAGGIVSAAIDGQKCAQMCS